MVGRSTGENSIAEFEVNFYGESCDTTAPNELPRGKYLFNLIQKGKLIADLYVAKITGGHVYEDLLEPQKTPGLYYPKPEWLIIANYERISDPEIPDDEFWYSVEFEIGKYAIYTYTIENEGLWFCSPITIVDL